MKFTRYFEAMRQRPDRAAIRLEWIQYVIDNPLREVIQRDGRIRRWAAISEMDGRYLPLYCCLTEKQCTTRFPIARFGHENSLL